MIVSLLLFWMSLAAANHLSYKVFIVLLSKESEMALIQTNREQMDAGLSFVVDLVELVKKAMAQMAR